MGASISQIVSAHENKATGVKPGMEQFKHLKVGAKDKRHVETHGDDFSQ